MEILPCLLSLLRFRKLYSAKQIPKLSNYFNKISEKYSEPVFLRILDIIKAEFEKGDEKFGKIEKPKIIEEEMSEEKESEDSQEETVR